MPSLDWAEVPITGWATCGKLHAGSSAQPAHCATFAIPRSNRGPPWSSRLQHWLSHEWLACAVVLAAFTACDGPGHWPYGSWGSPSPSSTSRSSLITDAPLAAPSVRRRTCAGGVCPAATTFSASAASWAHYAFWEVGAGQDRATARSMTEAWVAVEGPCCAGKTTLARRPGGRP